MTTAVNTTDLLVEVVVDYLGSNVASSLISFGIRLAGALLVLAVAWTSASFLQRILRRTLVKAKLDKTLSVFLVHVVRWLVLGVAVLACLSIFNIGTSTFSALIVTAGVAVGLALQGTLSNCAAGAMLLMLRPFRVDDFVVTAGYYGQIVQIGLFVTTMRTLDAILVTIPNSSVFGGPIENKTSDKIRQAQLTFTAGHTADPDHTRELLEKLLRDTEGVLAEPKPSVDLCGIDDRGLEWTVRAFAPTPLRWDLQQRLTRNLKLALDGAGIPLAPARLTIEATLHRRHMGTEPLNFQQV